MLWRELLREVNDIGHEKISGLLVLLKNGHAFAFEALHKTWLRHLIRSVDKHEVAVEVFDLPSEAEQGFFQGNFLSNLKIVAFPLENWMVNLLDHNEDAARPNVCIFIARFLVLDFVAVNSAFLNVDVELVQASNEQLRFADMAFGSCCFAFTLAVRALSLELLHKPGSDLLFRNDLALAVAVTACFDVIWIVSTRPTAMRTDDIPIVGDFKVLASVQFL